MDYWIFQIFTKVELISINKSIRQTYIIITQKRSHDESSSKRNSTQQLQHVRLQMKNLAQHGHDGTKFVAVQKGFKVLLKSLIQNIHAARY